MRRLTRLQWSFWALAIGTIGVSVGANVAVFTIVNALWVRPLPVPDADRLVVLMDPAAMGEQESVIIQRLDTVRDSGAFESVAGQVVTVGDLASLRPTIELAAAGRPLETLAVTPGYFATLGIGVRGRSFAADDDRVMAEPVAIISDRLWQEAFDRRADTIGAMVPASPVPVRIIGIAPREFRGARRGEDVDVWVPSNLTPRVSAGGPGAMAEDRLPLLILGRLRQGAALADVKHRLVEAATTNERRMLEKAELVPLADVFGTPDARTIVVNERGSLHVVSALAGLVLVAGCVTLLTLVLVYYEGRRREFAIRAALGSSHRRSIGVLSRELIGLVVIGTVVAVLVSSGMLAVLPALRLTGGTEIGRLDLSIDWRVMATALAATAAIVAVAVVMPMRRLLVPDAVRLIAGSFSAPPSSRRLRQSLLAVHVAATVVVLVGAGLSLRSVQYGGGKGAGFDATQTLLVEAQPIALDVDSASDMSREARTALVADRIRRMAEAFRALPGVTSLSFGELPVGGSQLRRVAAPVTLQVGDRTMQTRVGMLSGSAGLLSTLGVPVLEGRSLTEDDALASPRPAVVTRSLAATLWPEQSALGELVAVGRSRYTIVGITPDIAYGSIVAPAAGVLVTAQPDTFMSPRFVIRANDPGALVPGVRRVVDTIVGGRSYLRTSTGDALVDLELGRQRLGVWLFSGFGLIALVLSAGGTFGLVAYIAQAHRREFSLRYAIGATQGDNVRLAFSAVVIPVAAGAIAGLLLTVPLGYLYSAGLVGVSAFDPPTFVAVTLLTLGIAACSGLVGASRVMTISPSDVMRYD